MLHPTFSELLDDFDLGRARFPDDYTSIFVLPAGRPSELREFVRLGHLRLWAEQQETACIAWSFDVYVHRKDSRKGWFRHFKRVADRAGLHLPPRLKNDLRWCSPSTPFAWWWAVTVAYGLRHPSPVPIINGHVFVEPYEQSVRAIERCPYLATDAAAIETGE